MDTNRSNGNDDYDDDGDGGDNVEYDDGDNVEYDGRDNAEYDGGDDNFTVEDDVEADAQDDQIPENHYKMVAFQTAIQAVLERQIEKLQLEVNENARLVTIGTKESQEAAKHLHDEQKCLVLEEDNVRSAAERLDRTQSRRERREKENRDYRAEVERSEADLEQRIVHNEQLRAEVNDLTGQSLRYQLRRLEVEGEVGVDQACSDKGEQDFKVAQEAKQFQDKYIGKRVGDRRCGDRAPPHRSAGGGGGAAGGRGGSVRGAGGRHGPRHAGHPRHGAQGRGGAGQRAGRGGQGGHQLDQHRHQHQQGR